MSSNRPSFFRLLFFSVIALLMICVFAPIIGPLIFTIIITLKTTTHWQIPEFIVLGSFVLPTIILIIALIFVILSLVSAYPEISLTDTGIQYQSILNHGFIKWEEVARMTRTRGLIKTKVIIINRSGVTLLKPKGLFYNMIQGIQLGINEPVIALWGNEEEIENKIKEKKK